MYMVESLIESSIYLNYKLGTKNRIKNDFKLNLIVWCFGKMTVIIDGLIFEIFKK